MLLYKLPVNYNPLQKAKHLIKAMFFDLSSSDFSSDIESSSTPAPQLMELEITEEPHIIHIPFHYKTEAQMGLLMKCQALFQQQLSNMDKDYIISILFSKSHESFLLISEDRVLAGLCFKQLFGLKIIELCMMASMTHRKGYGSKLVNYLKCIAQKRSIDAIYTHADNTAIDFYRKLGFSTTEFVDKGILGDEKFSSSTLMQARIDKNIDYPRLRGILMQQKEMIAKEFKELQKYQSFKITASNQYKKVKQEYFKLNPDCIPGIYNFNNEYKQLKQTKQQIIYRNYLIYLDRMIAIAHPEILEMKVETKHELFLNYNHPIDLMAIKKNILKQKYKSQQQMLKDLEKLIINCGKFYKCKPEMIKNILELETQLEAIKKDISS